MNQRSFNVLYVAYLEHSVRYYEMDESIISDELYDRLCRALLRHWHSFNHSLKHLTDVSALQAGSGYHLTGVPALDRIRTMIRLYGTTSILDALSKETP